MLPIVNGLEKEYAGRITFTRVNILNPKSAPLMAQYGFTTAPELYLVNAQGRIIGSWDNLVSAKELRQAFERAVKQ